MVQRLGIGAATGDGGGQSRGGRDRRAVESHTQFIDATLATGPGLANGASVGQWTPVGFGTRAFARDLRTERIEGCSTSSTRARGIEYHRGVLCRQDDGTVLYCTQKGSAEGRLRIACSGQAAGQTEFAWRSVRKACENGPPSKVPKIAVL